MSPVSSNTLSCSKQFTAMAVQPQFFELTLPTASAQVVKAWLPLLYLETPVSAANLSPLWPQADLSSALKRLTRSKIPGMADSSVQLVEQGRFDLPVRLIPGTLAYAGRGTVALNFSVDYPLGLPKALENRALALLLTLAKDTGGNWQRIIGNRGDALNNALWQWANRTFANAKRCAWAESTTRYSLPVPIRLTQTCKTRLQALKSCLNALPTTDKRRNDTQMLMQCIARLSATRSSPQLWNTQPTPRQGKIELRVPCLEYSLRGEELCLWRTDGSSECWEAISGGREIGKAVAEPLPLGLYETKPNGLDTGFANPDFQDKAGNVWFIRLRNLFVSNRGITDWSQGGAFGVHPDGGEPGTAGCIGLKAKDTSAIRNAIHAAKPLYVYVGG